jgi:hypothetical protein
VDELTERLIRADQEIHHILQTICDAGHGEPFFKLLRQAATKARAGGGR